MCSFAPAAKGDRMKFEYLIFDMDGIMVDSESVSYTILKNYIAESGYDLSPAEYLNLIGISDAEMQQRIRDGYEGVDPEGLSHNWETEYEKVVKRGDLPVKPGLYELLDELDKRRIPRAVGSSNSARWIGENLRSIGVYDRVDTISCADTVENCKPAPDLFLQAAEKLGAKDLSRCLVLEDSRAGVLAANNAGIPVIMIPDLHIPDVELRSRCFAVCDTLADVIPYLAEEGTREK